MVHTCNTQLFRICFHYTLTNSRHLLEYPVMCVASLSLKLWPICEEIFLSYNKKLCRSTWPTYILHIKILVFSFLLFSCPQHNLLSPSPLSHMVQSHQWCTYLLTFIIWIATRFYFDLQREMRWCIKPELLFCYVFFEEFTTTICRQTSLRLNLWLRSTYLIIRTI